MTDLFNQLGGTLTDFKMRNIDSAGLHEIIGEFAPLIGVATDGGNKSVKKEEVAPGTIEIKKEIKEEPVEDLNEEKPHGKTDSALDLSVKQESAGSCIDAESEDSMHGFQIKIEPLVLDLGPSFSVKREPSDSTLIDSTLNKKARLSNYDDSFKSTNSSSPVNSANEKESPENINLNKDTEDSRLQLLYEVKNVNDLKYYQCKLCPKIYDTKYHLNRHLISHGGNRPHCCDKCGKSFSQKCDLNRHMNVHFNLRKHTCSVCGKTFKRADYLSKHERQYCGVNKPHKCTKCCKGFEELEQLQEHSCSQTVNDFSSFTCEHCPESFDNVEGLVEHRKTHKSKPQDYQCTKCKQEFTDFLTYVGHFKQHSGERPYSCDLCQKVFTRNHNLMTHMWIHNDEKQHTCHICAKTFTYYSNLQVHLRVHRNERPYKCIECDKGFLTSSDLRRHQRTHSGEKPYKCEQCPAMYARKERLISHMITHVVEGVKNRDMTVDGGNDSVTNGHTGDIEIKVEVTDNGYADM